jgi:hypothetical protein
VQFIDIDSVTEALPDPRYTEGNRALSKEILENIKTYDLSNILYMEKILERRKAVRENTAIEVEQ